MKLLVDIGNHRLKWATTDAAGALDGHCGVLGYADARNATDDPSDLPGLAAQLAGLDTPESVWVSCVARPQIRRAMVEYARGAWSLQPVFMAAQKQQASIVNGYPDPASLGSDRWAALVAAADLFPRRPLIVVDAGTAVTVDLLDGDGAFRGGVIFPGVHAMQSALGVQTANITGDITNDAPADSTAQVNAIATDTPAALAGGALLAVAGGISLAVARQRAALPDDCRARCRLIATGGDAGRLAPLLHAEAGVKIHAKIHAKIHIEPQLVLRGLAVLAREPAP